MTEVANRYDAVLLFEVTNGNPNGDPDAGNMPRTDPETGHGITTDVMLKRKVRNYVELVKGEDPGYEIYVKEKAVLIRAHERAHEAVGADTKGDSKKRKGSAEEVQKAQEWMCHTFYDVRTFGAVMGLKVNAGQVRGPIQITFSRSIDPVLPLEHCITRVAVATEAEAEKQQGDNRTMGRKATIPYGLYRAHVFVSPQLAQQTGFSQEDLDLFWEALLNMFEHDHSAARGMMSTRALYVFKHKAALGNAPAHQLFERLKVARSDESQPPRSFSDYEVGIDTDNLPDGIELLTPGRPTPRAA